MVETRKQSRNAKPRKRKYSKKSDDHIKIAKERINKLFGEAELIFNSDSSLSNRYVELARKIAMKFKVRIDSSFRRRFCKHCYKYLIPGKNLRVRVDSGKVIYYCLECKKFWRMPVGNRFKNKK